MQRDKNWQEEIVLERHMDLLNQYRDSSGEDEESDEEEEKVSPKGGEEDTGVRAGTEAAGASRRKCPKAVEVSAPSDGRSTDAQTNER